MHRDKRPYCTTCCRELDKPWRVTAKAGVVVAGCISPAHDGYADAASYRCEACNGGPEHHDGDRCRFHWVYRGRDGRPFRLVRL